MGYSWKPDPWIQGEFVWKSPPSVQPCRTPLGSPEIVSQGFLPNLTKAPLKDTFQNLVQIQAKQCEQCEPMLFCSYSVILVSSGHNPLKSGTLKTYAVHINVQYEVSQNFAIRPPVICTSEGFSPRSKRQFTLQHFDKRLLGLMVCDGLWWFGLLGHTKPIGNKV